MILSSLRGVMRTKLAVTISAALLFSSGRAAEFSCPLPNSDGLYLFDDGSIGMVTELAVNPDGSAASYAPGDHGFTYISNGVNLIQDGQKVSCLGSNGRLCRTSWALAESQDFGPGSPEFCSFAIAVEPFSAEAGLFQCEDEASRYVIGNGKGRPQLGEPVATVQGGEVRPYVSKTSLEHLVGGARAYVDSAAIPALVVPRSYARLVGSMAWVNFNGNASYAIVNDTGPSFGEGSIALHEMLRRGRIGPLQPIGPIGVEDRCSATETELRAPFLSRPDFGEGDRCRPSYTPGSASDIRAYRGISGPVTSIFLPPESKPAMRGNVVQEELQYSNFSGYAASSGFSHERIQQMAACLEGN